jgi:hypothetical protein
LNPVYLVALPAGFEEAERITSGLQMAWSKPCQNSKPKFEAKADPDPSYTPSPIQRDP